MARRWHSETCANSPILSAATLQLDGTERARRASVSSSLSSINLNAEKRDTIVKFNDTEELHDILFASNSSSPDEVLTAMPPTASVTPENGNPNGPQAATSILQKQISIESGKASSASSASSVAKRIVRRNKSVRHVGNILEKFSVTGSSKNKSLSSVQNESKDMPPETMIALPGPPESPLQSSSMPEKKDVPRQTASATSLRSRNILRKSESDPDKSIPSYSMKKKPGASVIFPHSSTRGHSKSESDHRPRRDDIMVDSPEHYASAISPLQSTVFSQKARSSQSRSSGSQAPISMPHSESTGSSGASRPSLSRFRTSSSALLRRNQSSDSPAPPSEGTPSETLSPPTFPNRPPLKERTSFRRWLWPELCTNSDSPTIHEEVTTPQLDFLRIESVVAPGISPLSLDPPEVGVPKSQHSRLRRTRFSSNGIRSSEIYAGTPSPPLVESSEETDNHSYFPKISKAIRPHGMSRYHSAPNRGSEHMNSSNPLTPPSRTKPPSPALPPPEGKEYFEPKRKPIRRGTGEFVPPGLTRVNTPPQFKIGRPASGASTTKFAAGFFFELEGEEADDPTPRRGVSTQSPQTPGGFWDSDAILMSQAPVDSDPESPGIFAGDKARKKERDWFRVRMDDIMAGEAEATGSDEDFEWDVPEHLPGSPLCPLSPKHKSGGKGICVYHGRAKAKEMKALKL